MAGASLALLLAVLIGCGGGGTKRASVEGSVSYYGKPIDNGSITFCPGLGGREIYQAGRVNQGWEVFDYLR